MQIYKFMHKKSRLELSFEAGLISNSQIDDYLIAILRVKLLEPERTRTM